MDRRALAAYLQRKRVDEAKTLLEGTTSSKGHGRTMREGGERASAT